VPQKEITWETLGRDFIAASSGVFLVAGKTSFAKSGAEEKLSELLGDKSCVRFSDYTENPKLAEISAGVAAYNASKCDLIIGIGGGSAIDVAKAIHLFAGYQEEDHAGLLSGKQKLEDTTATGRGLIAVPTTFGTGSESTHFAVVYIGDNKYSLAHAYGLPSAYILDPALALTAPASVRATTGTDALCQAIESYWAVAATDESRTYASKALTLLKDNLVPFVQAPTELVAANMARAANYAGRAINLTKTTAPHALSYALTKTYGIPHGLAVSLTLPAFFVLNETRGNKETLKAMIELYQILGITSAQTASIWFKNLIASTGQPVRLAEIRNLSGMEIVKLVEKVNLERLTNHPVLLTKEDLMTALVA